MKRALISLGTLAFSLTSCASAFDHWDGDKALQAGNYQAAGAAYEKATEAGHILAPITLGVLVERGLYKARYPAEHYYFLAAKKGYPEAMTGLARVHWARGESDLAQQWATQAAKKGDAEAAALLQARGLPVPPQTFLGVTGDAWGQLFGAFVAGLAAGYAQQASKPGYRPPPTYLCSEAGFDTVRCRPQ